MRYLTFRQSATLLSLLLLFAFTTIGYSDDNGLSPRESMKQFFNNAGLGEFEVAKKYLEIPTGKVISDAEVPIFRLIMQGDSVAWFRL